MAGIFISIGVDLAEIHDKSVRELERIKKLRSADQFFCNNLIISKFSRHDQDEDNILSGSNLYVCSVGTAVYKNCLGKKGLAILRDDILAGNDVNRLTSFFDGHFVVVIFSCDRNLLQIITDHAGIINLYKYEDEGRIFLSTSAMVLSKHNNVSMNPDAVTQFLRTGTVCDSSTIYNEINLCEPASVYSIATGNEISLKKEGKYWTSPTAIVNDLSIDETVDLLSQKLLSIGELFSGEKVICDLTGGFDSRMVLSSLWPRLINGKRDLSTFVFGPPASREVALVKQYCINLALKNEYLGLPDEWAKNFHSHVLSSLDICDGEENICNYAPILFANNFKAKKNYSFSLNGLGGELYRDFWWVQELLYNKRPANIERLVGLRVLQYEYDYKIFSDPWKKEMLQLKKVLSEKYTNTISDMDLNATFNSLQIDNIYLRQKIRRWAGRTITSSNHMIGAVAPLVFKGCLDIGMAANPNYKRNGKLVKKVISKISKELAGQVMLNGAPCEELSISNWHKFYPTAVGLTKRILRKTSQKVFKKTIFIDHSLAYKKKSWYQNFLSCTHDLNDNLLDYNTMISREIYDKERFAQFIARSQEENFVYYPQLENIISLELRMRYDRGCLESA